MAIFGPKPWVNPLEKCQFFDFLTLPFFLAQKVVFFVLEYHKKHFFGLNCLKKTKLEKWPFLYQNHGLILLEKCQFFNFLNFFFYRLERLFFVLEYHKRHFPNLYCLKKKSWKNGSFLDLNHGLTPLKNFFNFLFLQPRKAFFILGLYVRHLPGLSCLKKKVGKMAIF